MIIYFLDTEPAELEFFANNLAGHEVRFADGIDDVGDDAEIVSVFINTRIDDQFLAARPRLRLIATRTHSTDHLDLAACHARGVIACGVPPYADVAVAEHTFALMLALSRRLREIMMMPKGSKFIYEATRGFDLCGKTLGIVGMGHIGQRVARLARAFEMEVVAFDPNTEPQIARELHFSYVDRDELLRRSHVISLHAPLTAATYHFINAETLGLCMPGVLIINTARGALIHTPSLREALDSGQVGGAGLDVLQDERVLRDSASHIIAADIIKHLRSDALASEAHDADRLRELSELMLSDAILEKPNVVFTPHVAFNSEDAVQRIRQGTVENIAAFAAETAARDSG